MLNYGYFTVFSQCVGVEDVLKSVDRVEKCIEKSVGRHKSEEFVIRSVFVSEVYRRVEHECQLCKIEDGSLECSEDDSFVHNLGKGMTECTWFVKPGFETGIGLIGCDESVEGLIIMELRLSKNLKRLSWKKEENVGDLTLSLASS